MDYNVCLLVFVYTKNSRKNKMLFSILGVVSESKLNLVGIYLKGKIENPLYFSKLLG